MGKKEHEIKRLNKEFYKEYNNLEVDNIKKLQDADDKLEEIEAKKDAKIQRLENMARETITDMKEYSDHQGLELCCRLDVTNMENFINFVVKSCDVKNNWSNTKVEEIEEIILQPIVQTYMKPTDSSIEDIELDIIRIREKIIIEAGEFDILNNFIDSNHNGVYPPNIKQDKLMSILRKKMIKIAKSEQNYYDVVKRFGNYHYATISKSLDV
jgi:hypothetical protein